MKRTYNVILLLIIPLLLFSSFRVSASHIVGGELSYTYLGNNQYHLVLKIYRDCYNGTAPFDNVAHITIFNSSNTVVQVVNISFPGSAILPNNTGNPCLTAPPDVCVEEAVYEANVTLPPIAGGYTLAYQRCCRNTTAVNIDNTANGVGASFVANIPGTGNSVNNSPVFNNFPPTCICVNQPMVFDHASTDPDGDQLVYSLFQPFEGGSTGNTTPNPASPPPYTGVPYLGGYTAANPLGGSPALSINATTGQLTVTPNAVGQFVVGVSVKEYRNGVLIGTHYRDFQFNVVECLQTVNAILPTTMSACVGNSHTFVNNSTGATAYHWDFGVAGMSTDVSTLATPTYTYSTPGTYMVTLIANPSLSCASTVISTITVYAIPMATPSSNSPICQGSALNLFAVAIAGASYAWTGPNGFTSTQQNPTINNATVSFSGTYHLTLTVNGCTNTNNSNITVTVNPIPAAPIISSNSPLCSGTSLNLTAAAVTGGTYTWTGPNGFTSTQQNPTINPVAVVNTGTYTCTVLVNGCASPSSSLSVVVNPQPAVPTLVSNAPICAGSTLTLSSTSVAGTYSWSGPNGFTSTQQNISITNTTTANSGMYTFSVSANGCSTPATINAIVNAIPVATPTSNSPACTGQTIQLNAATVVGGTYAWSGPNGFTSALQNPVISNTTTTMAGTYALVVTANGCVSPSSTVTVVVNQTPAAPTVSSNTPICAGSTLNFTGNAVAGVTFSWSGPAAFTSTLQNPTITNAAVASSGTYALVVTSNGCSSLPSNTTVVVNPIPTATASSNSPICNGQNIQLNAVTYAGGTYAWTGPSGFTSTQQNPSIANSSAIAAGTYVLTVSANNCQSPVSNITVVVNPIPVAPVLSNDAPMCSGQTLHLIAQNVIGGTFNWTGPNSFTSPQQNPVITNVPFANNGVYSATATVLGCTSPAATINAVISLTPVATPLNNGPLCEGETLNLTTTAVAGATYAWTGPNGFTSTQQNPVITNVNENNTGSYSLTMTLAGCVGNAVTTNVVVKPIPSAPVIFTNSPLCAGQALQLNAVNVSGGTFTWTGPNAYTSTQQNPTIASPSTTASGTYGATVTVLGCTSPSSTISVLVKPVPAAPTVSSNTPLCAGQTLNLTASNITSGTFNWTGPTAFTSAVQNPSITNTATNNSGNYSATATVNGCVSVAATTNVIVYPIPVSTFSLSTPLCSGNPALINYTGLSAASATYNWNFNGAQVNTGTGQGPYTITWTNAGSYNVSLSVTENGCTSPVTSHAAIVYPVPSSTFTSPDSICLSDSALVVYTGTGTDSANYVWNFGGGVESIVSSGSHHVAFASPGIYNITLSVTEHGCTSEIYSRSILVNPVPTADFVLSPTMICPDQDVVVTYVGTGTSNANFDWSFANGSVNSGVGIGPYSIHFNNPEIDTLTLTVTEHACTSFTVKHALVVDSLPEVAFDVMDTLGCAPFNTSFVNRSKRGILYDWNFGDDATSTYKDPVHTYGVGLFNVRLVVTTSSGCIDSLAKPQLIDVLEAPVAKFSVRPEANEVIEVKEALYTFANHSQFSDGYIWFFGDGDTSQTTSPTHTYTDSGNYTVTLVAYNNIGCTDTFKVGTLYVIPNVNYFIPNTFSPNNDGMNDVYKVYGVSLSSIHMVIYDRLGEKVYETKNISEGWDGTYKNKSLNAGVYVYYGSIQTMTGQTIPIRGDVTLFR